jgi:hypothetical protein
VRVGSWLKIAKQSERRCTRRVAVVRSLEESRKASLLRGAYLRSDAPTRLQPATTDLLLYHTEIKREGRRNNKPHPTTGTAMGLLKLATTPPIRRPGNAFGQEIVRGEERSRGNGPCVDSRSWVKWHITVGLYTSEAETFSKKVSSQYDTRDTSTTSLTTNRSSS